MLLFFLDLLAETLRILKLYSWYYNAYSKINLTPLLIYLPCNNPSARQIRSHPISKDTW